LELELEFGIGIGILEVEFEVVLEQLDVLPLWVELKLRHWPNTAHSFISRLTNKKPVFKY
jgi:hypothetical protein